MNRLPVEVRPDGGSSRRGGGQRGALLLVLGSLIVSQIPVGSVLFAVPLLIASSKMARVSKMLFCYLAVVGIAVGLAAIGSWNRATGAFSSGLFLLSIHIPTVLGLGSALWSCTGPTRLGYRKRFLLSGSFVCLASAAAVLIYSGGNAAALDLRNGLVYSYSQLFPEFIGLAPEDFFDLFLGSAQLLLVPSSLLLLGFTIVVAESTSHKLDLAWQRKAARWSVPEDFVWFFLGFFFAAVLSSALRLSAPVKAVLWNCAILTSVVYSAQGFAILVFLIRRRNPYYPAHRLAIHLAVFSLLPGINLVVLVGVPLIGVLETWIVIRKLDKENSYEDHFES